MWRKSSWCLGIIVILCCSFAYAVSINEIMYNPSAEIGGTYNEWIELYNPANVSVNLTGWKIADPSNHVFERINSSIVEPYEYFILAKRPENITHFFNVSCNIARCAFSLSNEGETLLLKDSSDTIIENLSYSNSFGNGDGNSLCLVNSSWKECIPTPGAENKEIIIFSNTTNITSNITINKSCDFGISISSENSFDEKEDVEFVVKIERNYGDRTIISARGYVKDYFGSKKTEYKPWTNDSILNSLTKTYSPNLKEERLYGLFFNITELNCTDSDLSDNSISKLIYVGEDFPEECEKCKKCKNTTIVNKTCQNVVSGLSEKDINADSGIEYTSKEGKERKLAIYFFCVIGILMLVYFMLRKNG